jgi:hypothetical protein
MRRILCLALLAAAALGLAAALRALAARSSTQVHRVVKDGGS